MSEFGKKVRTYRKARGMTQVELAATVGRSHSMLSAVEAGTRQLHVDELVTFADALRVSPSALLGSQEADRYAEGFNAGVAVERQRILDAIVSPVPTERKDR